MMIAADSPLSKGEFIGYIGRIQSAQETPDWTKGPYIIQSLLILIAPTLFSASIYMILGRLIRLLDAESHSVIRTRWLTKIFVASDILSFFAQGGGGGILASSKDMSGFEKGENVIIGGLFIQLVGFGTFMIITALFHRRLLRYPTNASRAIGALWQRYLFVLYFVSAMILIRSIFRVIEYIQGYDGNLQSTEIWLYIFDATLMFLAMVALNVYHPSRIIGVKVKRGQELGTDLSHELLP